MNVFAVSGLVNAIISIVFGVLVIFENSRDQKNRTFFLLTLALAVWAGAYWRWMLATDYATALFWVRALSVASLFIPVFFFHWALLLIDADEFFINKVLVYGAYLVAIGTIYFVNTSYFITDLSQRSYFEFWPDSGVLYDVYFSYLYIGLITYSAYLLIKAFFVEPDKNKKGQILYVIFGGLFGFGGGLTNFPLWWGIDIPPYGNFLVAVFPFFLGYSILRYKLFNIRTMATEFMVFALLVFMFITTILSTNLTQMLMNGVFLAISAVVGITLIRIAHTLERTTEELSESNTRQENLIHFISHEVKGYLAKSEAAFAAIDEGDYGPVTPELKQMDEAALRETRKGVDTVMDILSAGNIKKGTIAFTMNPFDLSAAVSHVIESVRSDAENKHLMFSYEAEPGASFVINGDAAKLEKDVIRNIIMNAVLYTQQGFVKVSLVRVPPSENAPAMVRLAVSDSGVGIDPEDMAHLFTEGGHGKESIKINAHSTGYGLFIAKQIVDAHHGAIRAESEGKGKGSTFIVEFPAA